MYLYHNNILSIPAKLLYEDWSLLSYNNYQNLCKRGKLIRTKEGKGSGNTPLVSFYDLPHHNGVDFKQICLEKLGNPKDVVVRNQLENYLLPDPKAISFFASYRKADGKSLSEDKQREKATNCIILNAIQLVFKDKGVLQKMFGRKSTLIWQNVSEAVNNLNTDKWMHSLPGNHRILQRRFKEYQIESYFTFIHKGEGNSNKLKIKGDIADYLLATYCLPIKLSIPEVLKRYNEEKEAYNWDDLTEAAVYNWLYQPAQERIWTLARHGREAYNRKFQHTITRDKSNWFPNCYWGIDGTKLDWIHYDDEATSKMAAKLKIDVMFDVYSEKIIGNSLSFTENHLDHFKTIKMAVNESQARPYYMTYDHQSGHKMQRMQDLYSSLVAIEGGTHHPNEVGKHNNPAEQLFKRFQQQVITNFWFSDGQSIKVRHDDNKMNTDFILENKHQLMTTTQLENAWKLAVIKWNEAEHPHFKNQSRNQVYNHEMPIKESLSLFEIMDKMWINQTDPITYKAHGLNMKIGDDIYQYEVLDANGNIDLEFRRVNIGNKFIVRYDPDFLDGYVQLCMMDENKQIVNIANAEPKRTHQNIPVLMKEGDREAWKRDQDVKKLEFERDLKAVKELQARTGITPQKEIDNQELEIKLQHTLTKVDRTKLEAAEYDF